MYLLLQFSRIHGNIKEIDRRRGWGSIEGDNLLKLIIYTYKSEQSTNNPAVLVKISDTNEIWIINFSTEINL